MSGVIKPVVGTLAQGLLSVGPGSSPPSTLPTATPSNAVTGVWGYAGPIIGMPTQTSSPQVTCGVYGDGGVVGINAYGPGLTNQDVDPNGDGVLGFGGGNGVRGLSSSGNGVAGTSTNGAGVAGTSTNGAGVTGTSTSTFGVKGIGLGTDKQNSVGVFGATKDGRAGVFGQSSGSGQAGEFVGGVTVAGTLTIVGDATLTGDIKSVGTITVKNDVVLTGGQDCAEQFDADESTLFPGTVVVIGDDGRLSESRTAYDKRVAGVVSGGGAYRPAIMLDQRDSSRDRATVALVGKVYCNADADFAPIAVGDLLTTSVRPGFAMKAVDPTRCFGAVIGKALQPLKAGQCMIPILVALQ